MDQGAFARRCFALVNELAEVSGKIALAHFRTPLTVDQKSDASPVTIADRNAEAAMREVIRRAFPDHGIVGEEHGRDRAEAEWVWTLDPIDGTKSFINGVPLFGTLIGLLHDGIPWLGCINHPALNERWIGGAGEPTRFNGTPVRTRPCPVLAQATLYTTGPEYFTPAGRIAFDRLAAGVHHCRYGGTDCYGYAMVAAGWTDMVCESLLHLHDYSPLVPVIEGAGGVITDWKGRPLTLASDGDVIALGDPRLHTEVLALLAG